MMAKIGKNILENLTTGMYSDSKVSYREYIQNACDQIDKAIEAGIVSKEEALVDIYIDESQRYVTIEDNATGVPKDQFESQLGDIANSDKIRGKDKGFRGIGRLCGLAYCKELIFKTSYIDEDVTSIMRFDAQKMREMLSSDKKYTVDEILLEIMSIQTEKEDLSKHYFKVELIDINTENTELLDVDHVIKYLSFVAPVSYRNTFTLRTQIYEHASKIGYSIDEYRIKVNGADIFKEYRKRLYEGNENNKRPYDEIFKLQFEDFYDEEGNLVAWLWYGLSRFEKAIPKVLNPMYGFRMRQGNIQIGDNTVVVGLFKETRGNSYFVGEIFAVDKNLIPNSQRNYFNENRTRNLLENRLQVYFFDVLHNLYHVASDTKSNYKKIQEYTEKVNVLEQKRNDGFVDEEEKIKLELAVKEAAEKKNKAIKQLQRSENNKGDEGNITPELEVQRRIQQKFERKNVTTDAKKAEKKVGVESGEKVKYFTDKLSKLNKSERKLVRKIMTIIKDIVDEETAEKIQAGIEKDFR